MFQGVGVRKRRPLRDRRAEEQRTRRRPNFRAMAPKNQGGVSYRVLGWVHEVRLTEKQAAL